MFAGVNNYWCSEEEETSSPPEDGLTDGFSRIVERPWQMKRKLSSHSLTSSVQLTFGGETLQVSHAGLQIVLFLMMSWFMEFAA